MAGTVVLGAVFLLAAAMPARSAEADSAEAETIQPGQANAAIPPFLQGPEPGTLRASKIIGVPVIGMDHVRVGRIEDVLVDGSGRVRAVVIGVGGFLGVGEKSVAVPFDQLAWNLSDVPLTGGPGAVVSPQTAPSAQAAAEVAPHAMPGAGTTRDVLAAVQNQHSGRVTEATGPVEPQRPAAAPATIFAGDTPWHAEIRLTKAQLQDAPAFRFKAPRP
ncbi:PRC-barrel domain-containing protein [Methylobacterium sp. ID0610]|uniref:PRC-barrel domain-containing protein n=1 Tax=Methylobacterium carpenticola TaxID=3344827 RepID=UPI0036938901